MTSADSFSLLFPPSWQLPPASVCCFWWEGVENSKCKSFKFLVISSHLLLPFTNLSFHFLPAFSPFFYFLIMFPLSSLNYVLVFIFYAYVQSHLFYSLIISDTFITSIPCVPFLHHSHLLPFFRSCIMLLSHNPKLHSGVRLPARCSRPPNDSINECVCVCGCVWVSVCVFMSELPAVDIIVVQ